MKELWKTEFQWKIIVLVKMPPFPDFGEFLLSLAILWSEFGDSFYFYLATLVNKYKGLRGRNG